MWQMLPERISTNSAVSPSLHGDANTANVTIDKLMRHEQVLAGRRLTRPLTCMGYIVDVSLQQG